MLWRIRPKGGARWIWANGHSPYTMDPAYVKENEHPAATEAYR